MLVAASGCGATGPALTGPHDEAREEAPRWTDVDLHRVETEPRITPLRELRSRCGWSAATT